MSSPPKLVTAPTPQRLIVGNHAVLTPRHCAAIAPTLRTAVNCKINPSPALVQLVSAIELLGRRAAFSGSAEVGTGGDAGCSEHVLTSNTVADMLGITPRGVRDLAERGRLPACWHQRSWRFSLDAVLRYAAQRRR